MPPGTTSPAFSEQVDFNALPIAAGPDHCNPGFRMSLVALNHHYVRDGQGLEQLYDLRTDPYEKFNLIGPTSSDDDVARFRWMLLAVLTDDHGSLEIEKAYLAAYPNSLEDLVKASPLRPLAARH
jgi:hypothetical protein